MAWARFIIAAVLLISVVSCKTTEQKVVGRWQSEDELHAVTFNADGTANFESYGRSVNAQYKFTDQHTIKIEFDSPLGELEGIQIAAVSLEKDELNLNFQNGVSRGYLRVKD